MCAVPLCTWSGALDQGDGSALQAFSCSAYVFPGDWAAWSRPMSGHQPHGISTWQGPCPWPEGCCLSGISDAGFICGGIKPDRKCGGKADCPAASGIYIIFSLIVIFSCFDRIPAALASMVSSAFCPEAAAGGGAGYVVSRSIRYGISRGVFSNEAGLGTLAVLHGRRRIPRPMSRGCGPCLRCFLTR